MRILNLNSALYKGVKLPEKFLTIKDSDLLGTTQDEIISAVEKKILKKINLRNSKLNVSAIEYGSQNIIQGISRTLYSSYIIDRIETSEEERSFYSDRDYDINFVDGLLYAEKIIAYVLISSTIPEGRNTTTTQQIFPTLTDYISHFLFSPSFGYANLPIYYLNIINEKFTATVMQRRLIEVEQLGIYTIDVFDKNYELYSNNYNDFSIFARHFLTPDDNKFLGEHFIVDTNAKHIRLLDNGLVHKLTFKNESYSFNGSSEKPFMLNILSIFIFGLKKGYTVDIQEIVDFFDSHPVRKAKGDRIMSLLDFMKKYERGVNNLWVLMNK